jgi:hypothetical protein
MYSISDDFFSDKTSFAVVNDHNRVLSHEESTPFHHREPADPIFHSGVHFLDHAILWLMIICTSLLMMPFRMAYADNITIAPSSCEAPFLHQAQAMRWHQNYLMNPLGNSTTWVICPISTLPFQALYKQDFLAVVVGGYMDGASSQQPKCYFTLHSVLNRSQPPYILGAADKRTWPLDEAESDTNLWSAGREFSSSDTIFPEPGGTENLLFAGSFFCKLPPGYSISMLVLEYP